MKYPKDWPLCLNSRKITTKFSGVRKFTNFTVLTFSSFFLQIPSPGDNSTRMVITFDEDCQEGPRYIQVVIYDHITRRKT